MTERKPEGNKERWIFQYRQCDPKGAIHWYWLREGETELLGYSVNIVRRSGFATPRPGAIYTMTVDYPEGGSTSVHTGGEGKPVFNGMDESQDYTALQAKDRTAALAAQVLKRNSEDLRRNLVREALAPIRDEYVGLGRTGRAAFLALVIDEVTR